jgi:multidrug efflux system membrane fusion protein
VKPDQTVTMRPVTTGATEGDQTEMKSGVDAGDVLVTTGVDRLIEKSRVNAEVRGEAPKGDGGQKTGRGKSGKGKS